MKLKLSDEDAQHLAEQLLEHERRFPTWAKERWKNLLFALIMLAGFSVWLLIVFEK